MPGTLSPRYCLMEEKPTLSSIEVAGSKAVHPEFRKPSTAAALDCEENVSALVADFAHGLNNLLSVILGNVELAQSSLPPDSKASKLLAEAGKAALSSADLARELMESLQKR